MTSMLALLGVCAHRPSVLCLVMQVLELVGTTTLEDSLQCANARGIVCMTGMVGNRWALNDFNPMDKIPEAVYLTKYSGGLLLLS